MTQKSLLFCTTELLLAETYSRFALCVNKQSEGVMKKQIMKSVVVAAAVATSLFSLVSFAHAEGKKLEVVFIPKLVGIPWFNNMEQGIKDYAAKLGNMNVTTMGAPDADPAQQARIVEDAIAQQPDILMVIPNDPKSLEPVFARAQAAGIKVITQESASIKNATADVEFIILDQLGKQYIDALVKAKGSKGGYAIMVGGLTNESHSSRADAIVAYQKKNYPDLYQVSERLEGAESVDIAHNKTLELIQAHKDLIGVLYIGTLGPIGGANAVIEKNLIGKVAIIGTAAPAQAKKYLADKSITACIISNNPAKIGAAMLDVANRLFVKNEALSSITKVPHFGNTVIKGKAIFFHAEAFATVENADSFGF